MRKLLFMLTLCVACSLSYAQQSNDELLKKLVEKQILSQSEADELSKNGVKEEPSNKLAQTANKVRQAFNTPYMQFGGYGLVLYKYSDVAPVKHTIDPKVIFVSMKGELTKNLKYFILAEFIKPMPYEFYGEWTPSNEFNLKLGLQKTPLSIENNTSLTEIEGASNTRSIVALLGDDVQKLYNGKNNTGRDMGIQAYGSLLKRENHHLINYGIGIYQGTGLLTSDNNNYKDLSANVFFRPTKSFRIGGGAYFGQAFYTKAGDIDLQNHVRNRWVVSSDFRTDRFYARSEWIRANDGGIHKEGLHAMGLWYFVPKKWNAFAKADYYNQNKNINSEVMDYTMGINYYVYGSCRLQLNYTYSDYSENWGDKNSNTVLGQMQIVF